MRGLHLNLLQRKLSLILLQQLAPTEMQQDLDEEITEVQKRIDLLEEGMSGNLPVEEEVDHELPLQYDYLTAREFHNVNPFEGRMLWSCSPAS